MRLSKQGAAFVRAHEGFVPKYYLDPVGIGTIGVGFTWGSASFQKWWGQNRPGQKFGPGATMTAAEADSCLVYLCDSEYGAAVNKFLGGKAVPQNVFDAMCSMVYNCGPGALQWRWAAFIKAGDMVAAARAWKETAVTAKGKKLAGLVRRRKEEAELAQYGRYGGVSLPVDLKRDDGILERGEAGEEVRKLQSDLASLGYYAGKIDGVFGPGTESAILAFQRDNKLAADGKAGPVTLGRLTELQLVSHEPPILATQPDLPVTDDKQGPATPGVEPTSAPSIHGNSSISEPASMPATIEPVPVPSGNWLSAFFIKLANLLKGA